MGEREHDVGPQRARLRIRLGAAVVLLLVAVGIAILVSSFGAQGTTTTVEETIAPLASESAGTEIYVHLLGSVNRPGLYELRDDSRVIDAIAASGGFTDDADQTQLNLARLLSDGEQLNVPAIGETPAVPASAPGAVGGKVNLNTADATTLETLPRVGPAMSARIIDWRETNGRFATIDDLRGVTGIGEKTFAALKDLITV